MPIEVKIIEDKIPALLEKVPANARRLVAETVFEIAQIARDNAPVLTGELRDSIEADEEGGTVTASADHAGYVEFGTRFMSAQPYLQPAVDEVAPSFEAKTGLLIEVSWF